MNKQFTASEVRDWERAYKGTGAAKVFGAYADLLEAREKAVPVAWRTFDGEGNYDYRDYENNEHYRDWYVSRNGAKYANWVEPLYSHPAPSDAERLAEALRDDEGYEWPASLNIRDTKLHDDLGGPGQRIYTTAGRGYKTMKYIRHDIVHPAQAQPPAARVTDAIVRRMVAEYDAVLCGDPTATRTEGMRAALEAALAHKESGNE